jgi:zinc transport system ATP-binding protein
MTTPTPLLQLRDLHISLGGTDILKGVSADLARHQITAVVGLNGSGKTTLLRALLKEIPYRGSIRFLCGHDHTLPDPAHVGYVPQKLRLEANLPLTVRDLFGLALQKRPIFLGIRRRLAQQMEEMLAQVGAHLEILDRPMDKLSGGEQQRVLLALALYPQPELLLLDEPAAGIDFQDQEKFYELIDRLNRERQVTVVLVSHDMSMVSKHAHYVLCLRDGRIQCQGPPQTILTAEALRQTFGAETAVFAHHH